MKLVMACLVLAVAVAGCGSKYDEQETVARTVTPSKFFIVADWLGPKTSCESIREGVEIAELFTGCEADGTNYRTRGYTCDDGRTLWLLGDEGDPWRGSAYLSENFLSWEVHGYDPYLECVGD